MPQAETKSIARVVVDLALDREFEYRIPDSLNEAVHAGSQVVVPFGRSKRDGFVVALSGQAQYADLKDIDSVVGEKPLVDESLLELSRWIGRYYCAPVEQAVRCVLPAAVRTRDAGFREQQFVSLEPAAATDAFVETLRKRAPKQAAVVEILKSDGGLFLQELCRRAGTTAAVVQSLRKKGAVQTGAKAVPRRPEAEREILPTEPLELMGAQKEALDLIRISMDTGSPPAVLLYGVTGSGKTEVYLQAIEYALSQDGGAIVLVPEIALTPQTVERFSSRFGDSIAVLHSHLSQGERHDEWHRIHDGHARIAIGARSAVFAPIRNLKLIVVDEEHESSYKQEEAPRYNARDVAVMRGTQEPCTVVLGSATPALESYRNAKSDKYGLAVLPERVDNQKMPHMEVVDMRIEAQRNGGKPCAFSNSLINAMRDRLEKAEQTMLFLNRRGYASSFMCPQCGYVAQCGNCSVSMTCHTQDDTLKCHICGDVRKLPGRCPECGDEAYRMAGIGTQRVEKIVGKLFPQARVQRMDSDSTTAKNSHQKILGEFRTGRIDILVGTQMIAKGLHFPNVTLIGVIYADMGLHMPDFRAGERTFQLLTQVAGRAGRGEVSGLVVVQTYTPFHPAIQAARRLDFPAFYDQEIEFRKELSYPPFTRLVCITLRSKSAERASFLAETLAKAIEPHLPESAIIAGPAPAPIEKARGYYRVQIILRARSVGKMVEAIRTAVKNIKWPSDVTYAIDVDATSLL